MKKEKNFGVFTYASNDECIFQQYFLSEKKAIKYAEKWIPSLGDGEYIEVWQKEGGYWGASGEPILKSDN